VFIFTTKFSLVHRIHSQTETKCNYRKVLISHQLDRECNTSVFVLQLSQLLSISIAAIEKLSFYCLSKNCWI